MTGLWIFTIKKVSLGSEKRRTLERIQTKKNIAKEMGFDHIVIALFKSVNIPEKYTLIWSIIINQIAFWHLKQFSLLKSRLLVNQKLLNRAIIVWTTVFSPMSQAIIQTREGIEPGSRLRGLLESLDRY